MWLIMNKKITEIYRELKPEFSLFNFYRRIKLFWLEEAIRMWNKQVYQKFYNLDWLVLALRKNWTPAYSKRTLKNFVWSYIRHYNDWFINRTIDKLINRWAIQKDWDNYYVIYNDN